MYINRKTGEKVEAKFNKVTKLWDVIGENTTAYWSRHVPDSMFQAQYGLAMICPDKRCEDWGDEVECEDGVIHLLNESCNRGVWCPKCIPYIPEQNGIERFGETLDKRLKELNPQQKKYDVDNEPTFPICGTCMCEEEQTSQIIARATKEVEELISIGEKMTEQKEQMNEWWLKYKCSSCRKFSPDCPYIEKKTLQETGDSPACSLFEQSQPLMLPDEEIRNILQTGGTPMDFSRAIAEAELKHLEELGIVYVKVGEILELSYDACEAPKYFVQFDDRVLLSNEKYYELFELFKNAGYKKVIPLSDYKGEK
jgi:hypothetical protein